MAPDCTSPRRCGGAHASTGHLHGPRLRGRAHVSRPGSQAGRAAALPRLRCKGRRGDGLARIRRGHAALQLCLAAADLRHRARAAFPAVEPAEARRRGAGPGLEHRRLVHHEHQLAVVCARNHHELFHPDGGPRVSQLPERGGGHRGCHRIGSRHRTAAIGNHRELLGRYHALHPVCAAADLPGARSAAHRTRRHPEPEALHHGADAGAFEHTANDCPGTSGFAGSHQDAGHEWRRVLQYQQRAPLRESHALQQFPRNSGHVSHPRLAHCDARQDDRIVRPRLGGLRLHAAAVVRRRLLHLRRGVAAASTAARRRSTREQARSQEATRKARKSASASPIPRSLPEPPPTKAAARSTACTIRLRRSAG